LKAQVTEKELSERPLWVNGQLLLPLEPVAGALGISVRWDAKTKSLLVNGASFTAKYIRNGKAYLSTTEIEKALDVRVVLDQSTGVAKIDRPKVVLGELRDQGIWHEQEAWSPLRLLTEAMHVSVEWDQKRQMAQINGQDVPGVLRGSRVYISQLGMTALFPDLDTQWDASSFTLELKPVVQDINTEAL
jgi:hypothetical protein